MNESTDLEVMDPMLLCGNCSFRSIVEGQWSVENGRLTFRADEDPQPRRGPDLNGCCECEGVTFTRMVNSSDEQVLTGKEFEELRATARKIRERGA